MRTLATWCFRHRRLVLLFWVAALVVMTLLSKAVGTNYSNSFSLPHTESTHALQVLQSAAPKESGDFESVVFETTTGTVRSAAVEARITAMLGRLAALPHVTSVQSPYAPEGAAQISRNGTIAFARVGFDVQGQSVSDKAAQTFVSVATSADSRTLTVAVSGQVAEKSLPQSLGGSGPGIVLAGIVLLLVFGSLFAMALPLLSAV
ncbi:MAG TPA: MMPL family transporter, partial [Acidimicrobiales bacterium]|nr:MMPL family transporter [Acidimicrobiales bacterium]